MSKGNLLDITSDVEGVNASDVESWMNEHRSDIEASITAEMNQAARFGYGNSASPLPGISSFSLVEALARRWVWGTVLNAASVAGERRYANRLRS